MASPGGWCSDFLGRRVESSRLTLPRPCLGQVGPESTPDWPAGQQPERAVSRLFQHSVAAAGKAGLPWSPPVTDAERVAFSPDHSGCDQKPGIRFRDELMDTRKEATLSFRGAGPSFSVCTRRHPSPVGRGVWTSPPRAWLSGPRSPVPWRAHTAWRAFPTRVNVHACFLHTSSCSAVDVFLNSCALV